MTFEFPRAADCVDLEPLSLYLDSHLTKQEEINRSRTDHYLAVGLCLLGIPVTRELVCRALEISRFDSVTDGGSTYFNISESSELLRRLELVHS